MHKTRSWAAKRPRVAAISLDDAQVESIRSLCGTLEARNRWNEYLSQHETTETDIAVSTRPPCDDVGPKILLILPPVDNLVGWFHAFLRDVHSNDDAAVPQRPLRLADPTEWYTPDERDTARSIQKIDAKVEKLQQDRDEFKAELEALGHQADQGIRRAVLEDGNELVDAVQRILEDLGLRVTNMDDRTPKGEAKNEDLRLTHPEKAGWEAIAEIKGYTGGTKTNEAEQVRRHREQYILDHNRAPNLTLWITNAHKSIDPSARPLPDSNVDDKAKIAGAI